MTTFTLGTRGSALALAQADMTTAALHRAWPVMEVQRQIFVTRGDQKLDLSLLRAGEAGGKGLFTRELEEALLAGTIDVAVHSLKDLPGHNPEGLEIVAVLERAPVADVLVCKQPGGFAALPQGARIGTSSVRRARQLQWKRPDLGIEEWRGNVPTRLRKLGERDDIAGIILAEAGLRRLGYLLDFEQGMLRWDEGEACVASLGDLILPAIGQGAVALQARANRDEVRATLAPLNHAPTMTAIRAEREIQRLLSGDCALPVGVRSTLRGETLALHGILFGPDGQPPATAEAEGPAAEPEQVARELFGRLGPAGK